MTMNAYEETPNQSVKHDERKRGFTLTEIAIVLGIIGLVLGAIWVAATAVYSNMRVSKATTEMLQITQGIRALYATATFLDPNSDMTFSGPAGNTEYLAAGIFPVDTLDTGIPATATVAYNPWHGSISVASQTSVKGGVNPDAFDVGFDAIPTDACIKLITTGTGPGRDSGMYLAGGGANKKLPKGSAVPDLTTPDGSIAASTAQGQCNTTAGNTSAVAFYFKLKG